MKAVLVILILGIVALIAAIQTGMIDISQNRAATAPQVAVENGAIRASGGQAPSFDVETGSVGIGRGEANVTVPQVRVERGSKTVSVPRLEIKPAGDRALSADQATTNAQP